MTIHNLIFFYTEDLKRKICFWSFLQVEIVGKNAHQIIEFKISVSSVSFFTRMHEKTRDLGSSNFSTLCRKKDLIYFFLRCESYDSPRYIDLGIVLFHLV